MNGLFQNTTAKSVAGVPLISEGLIIGALILIFQKTTLSDENSILESLGNIAALSAPFLRNVQKIRQFFRKGIPESSLILKYNNAGLIGKGVADWSYGYR